MGMLSHSPEPRSATFGLVIPTNIVAEKKRNQCGVRFSRSCERGGDINLFPKYHVLCAWVERVNVSPVEL